MRLTKRIIQVGNALGITIDKHVLEKMKLKKGDIVETEIKKAE